MTIKNQTLQQFSHQNLDTKSLIIKTIDDLVFFDTLRVNGLIKAMTIFLRWIAFIAVWLNVNLALGQQSLFNVPSVETTEKNKFFFQEQIDFFTNGIANTTIDYGLGNGWEAGVTVPGVNLYTDSSLKSDAMLLVNVQQGFYVNQNWKVGIGTQTGYSNPTDHSNHQFATFNYWNNAFEFENIGKYYLGVYHANKIITGDKSTTHILAGAEIPIADKLHIMTDYIGGKSDIAATVLGLVWYQSKSWQFSAGSQFSSSQQHRSHLQGLVIEFTFIQQ